MNVTNTAKGLICKFGFNYVSIETSNNYLFAVTACVRGDERGTTNIAGEGMRRILNTAIAHYTNPEIVAALEAIKAHIDEIDAEREPPRDFLLLSA